jgi:hypothetical protein
MLKADGLPKLILAKANQRPNKTHYLYAANTPKAVEF